MTLLLKHMVGRMSSRGNVVGRKYPFREFSIREVSDRESIRRGNVLRESVSLQSVHGEVSVEELSGYQFISETFSEELF